MNNLRKFSTEADYSAATLNYPAVSWVVSGDTVHFDKGAAPVVNDKVIMAAYGGTGEGTFIFFNCAASSSGDITSIIFDNVEVNPITCEGDYVDAEQTYIAKYTITGTTVGDWLSGDLGCGAASEASKLDILIPSQITSVGYMPNNFNNLVIEATTPPTISALSSGYEGVGIYVPDDAVNAYKSVFHDQSSYIHPISEYSGNLPV